jgi:uncharacterized damage-inducible protein DinB
VNVAGVFLELFARVPTIAHEAAEGLDAEQLAATPATGANSIGWLVWHLARVQDHYISEYLGEPQLWATGDWAAAVGLDPDPGNTGYGHSPADVAAVRPTGPAAVLDYLDAVDERTRSYLGGITARSLDRIVDPRWDPPVTLGVRLVSVADDCLQHAGQAAYVRGLLVTGSRDSAG